MYPKPPPQKKKLQYVELMNIIRVKYLSIWINYNIFSIGEEEIKHRIDCARDGFTQQVATKPEN